MTRLPLDNRTSAPLPKLLDAVGILAIAGSVLAVLLVVGAPFDGPWVVVTAVAAVFAGLYVGFFVMVCASNLRILNAICRRLPPRADRE